MKPRKILIVNYVFGHCPVPKIGSIQIVSEMLMCKNRSVDAKNDEGQTAAHIASMNGFPEILSLLIRAGTNVNAKDSASCTPLHV